MIEVEIEAAAWTGALPEAERLAAAAAEAALQGEAADLVVLLSDDATVRELNARYRGKDSPTNVLSFPAPGTARPHLGDVVLAHGVCAREAVAQGKSLADHLSHLVVHGVLHLRGRDHETDPEAAAMEDEERTILASLGVSDPYLCRNGT